MTGVAKNVTDLQHTTGVKDKVTKYWINLLAWKRKKLNPCLTQEALIKELTKWLNAQPGDKMNPLLDIAGMLSTGCHFVSIKSSKVSIHLRIPPLKYSTPFSLAKYVWHNLHSSWSDEARELFAIHIQSTDIDGLTILPIQGAYMVQYRNNLIGKQFKALMQMMIFHLHNAPRITLVMEAQFQLVRAVGALGAVLWEHQIENMEEYLVCPCAYSQGHC
jgi:hypothetical protein